MRNSSLLVLLVAASLCVPATTAAEYVLPVGSGVVSVSPKKAGTKKRPAAVALRATIDTNVEQSRVSTSEIVLNPPPSLVFDGRGLRAREYCTVAEINEGGVRACSRKAEIGTRTGNGTDAVIYPRLTPLRFKVRVFLAAPDELAVHLASQTPGINIEQAIPGFVTRTAGRQRISIQIPPELVQPIPGLYVGIKQVRMSIRRMRIGSGRSRHPLLGLTGCPRGGLPFSVRVNLVPNPAPPAVGFGEGSATAPCRR